MSNAPDAAAFVQRRSGPQYDPTSSSKTPGLITLVSTRDGELLRDIVNMQKLRYISRARRFIIPTRLLFENVSHVPLDIQHSVGVDSKSNGADFVYASAKVPCQVSCEFGGYCAEVLAPFFNASMKYSPCELSSGKEFTAS